MKHSSRSSGDLKKEKHPDTISVSKAPQTCGNRLGGTQVPNGYCQTAAQSRSGERQNIGVVNSFEGEKGGGGRSTSYLAPNA